jgi:hypothetical protein
MRRLHKFLMILTAIASLTPALARAQGVAHDPSSTATFTGASSAHRGFGVGVEGLYWPTRDGADNLVDPNHVVPNVLATWGDSAGRFHVDGLFGFLSHNTNNFDIGVRGWYHLHATSFSDLSAGGGFTLISWKQRGGTRQTDFQMELGAQIRAFVVSNVALLGSVGMNMYFPDSGSATFIISGNLVGAIGLAYYFQ